MNECHHGCVDFALAFSPSLHIHFPLFCPVHSRIRCRPVFSFTFFAGTPNTQLLLWLKATDRHWGWGAIRIRGVGLIGWQQWRGGVKAKKDGRGLFVMFLLSFFSLFGKRSTRGRID
jgi:hypothetical protein